MSENVSYLFLAKRSNNYRPTGGLQQNLAGADFIRDFGGRFDRARDVLLQNYFMLVHRCTLLRYCSGHANRLNPHTSLDISGFVNHCVFMQSIKISSKVDADIWEELKTLARESHQNVSGLLTEAISEYIQRKRVRPVVLKHLEDSMNENDELGKLLAK